MKTFAILSMVLIAGVIAATEIVLPKVEEGPGPTTIAPAEATGKITLEVVRADSEEATSENGRAANAVDGNTNSIWHTQWQDASPPCPHEIIIKLSEAVGIKGFTYLPRQDESDHGGIKEYEFYTSDDGKEFGKPIKKGEFTADKMKKTIMFDGKKCRFIKLRALSEINGEPWTSAAEINIVLAD